MAEIEPAQGVQEVTEAPTVSNAPVATIKPKTITTLTLSSSAIADVNGNAQIIFTPQGAEWRIERGFVTSDSTGIPTVGLYVNVVDDMHIRDEVIALRVLFDNSKRIYVRNGDAFIVSWAGADAGSNCRVTVQVEQES